MINRNQKLRLPSYNNIAITHFTLTGGNKAGVDLAFIQPFLLYYVNHVFLTLTSIFKQNLHQKRKEVCIKTRSTSASRSLKGQNTQPTTVKWPIPCFRHGCRSREEFLSVTAGLLKSLHSKKPGIKQNLPVVLILSHTNFSLSMQKRRLQYTRKCLMQIVSQWSNEIAEQLTRKVVKFYRS